MPFESPDSHTFAMPEVAHGYEAGKKKGKKLEKKVSFELVFFVPIANPSDVLVNSRSLKIHSQKQFSAFHGITFHFTYLL